MTSIRFLIRAFTDEGLIALERFLDERAKEVVASHRGSKVEIEIKHSYKNMKTMLDRCPEAVAFAEEAIRAADVTPHRSPIRGGTDGARLSFMGLPTPNLFAGGFNFHGKKEWVPLQYMEKSAEVCLRLIRIWAEHGQKRGLLPKAP
jgi:tripeptide aminopeptidase